MSDERTVPVGCCPECRTELILMSGRLNFVEAAPPSEPKADPVEHPTYGNLRKLVNEIEKQMQAGYWPRLGQMGALYWFADKIDEMLAAAPPSEPKAAATQEANIASGNLAEPAPAAAPFPRPSGDCITDRMRQQKAILAAQARRAADKGLPGDSEMHLQASDLPPSPKRLCSFCGYARARCDDINCPKVSKALWWGQEWLSQQLLTREQIDIIICSRPVDQEIDKLGYQALVALDLEAKLREKDAEIAMIRQTSKHWFDKWERAERELAQMISAINECDAARRKAERELAELKGKS